ncbi:unnamed protein product, partial [Durusdinium trenchii]
SLRISDLASAATCHELLALAVRRVVRMWHAGVGESVASYSAAYPFELVTRMASGAVSAFRSQAPALPLGRSSSYAISRILQGSLAYILGSGLYPGCLHCASGDNRSDGPSSEPASRAIPAWLKELIDGDPGKFDKVVQSSKISRNPARWLRFLLMLCGDIHPHPGPRARRGPMDLSVGFVKETSSRMQRPLCAWQLFGNGVSGLGWLCWDLQLCCTLQRCWP